MAPVWRHVWCGTVPKVIRNKPRLTYTRQKKPPGCEWKTKKPRRNSPPTPLKKIIIPYLNEFSLLVKLQVRNEIWAVVLEQYSRNSHHIHNIFTINRCYVPSSHCHIIHWILNRAVLRCLNEWLVNFKIIRVHPGDNTTITSLSDNSNTTVVFNYPNLQRMGKGGIKFPWKGGGCA
jgi:hypothetical protein